jgi:hypothetical protein
MTTNEYVPKPIFVKNPFYDDWAVQVRNRNRRRSRKKKKKHCIEGRLLAFYKSVRSPKVAYKVVQRGGEPLTVLFVKNKESPFQEKK